MSRTYRNFYKNKWASHRYSLKEYVCGFNKEGKWYSYYEYIDPTSKEGQRRLKMGKCDLAVHAFKEPGPAWFRNVFNERPNRRRIKRELQKWVKNPDYEVQIILKWPLDYWT